MVKYNKENKVGNPLNPTKVSAFADCHSENYRY